MKRYLISSDLKQVIRKIKGTQTWAEIANRNSTNTIIMKVDFNLIGMKAKLRFDA